jgi:tetratricopeptide (TPR) repeat protein
MSRTATCPHGHQWELAPSGTERDGDRRLICPVCGAGVELDGGSTAKTVLESEHAGRAAEHEPTVRLRPSSPLLASADPVVVPGYEVLEELGHGGMGVVYKARQAGLNRLVALKMIRPGRRVDAQEVARLRTEAEAVARLQHPNIVQVFEVGEAGGRPYFSLEFVPGGSLAQHLGGTPLPAQPAAQLVETLARAVHYAHQRGVVHRDLKPANILISGEWRGAGGDSSFRETMNQQAPLATPKVTDFGLAKYLDNDASQTETGMVVGTPSYMAPEQAWGKSKLRPVGPPVDIYALGAILYELLTGRPPFKGESPVDTLQQVVSQEPVPPTSLHAKVPRDLETICLKCLEKDPAKRYPSAEALADDLGRWLRGEPIRARPVGRAEKLWRWCRRNPVPAALAAGLALALMLGFAGVVWQWREAVAQEQEARQAHRDTEKALHAANTERAKAQAINDFLIEDLLRAPRPGKLGLTVTLKKALDEAVPKIGPRFAKQPEVEASVRTTLANTYYELGQYREAEAQTRLALDIYRKLFPPGHPEYSRTLSAQNDLATMLTERGKLREAERIFRRIIKDFERIGEGDSRDAWTAWHNLASLYYHEGDYAKAEPIMRRVADACRRKKMSPEDIANADINLLALLRDRGKLAEA